VPNKPGSGNELNEQISGAVLMEAAALLNGQKILK
jgi:hypothetical protein